MKRRDGYSLAASTSLSLGGDGVLVATSDGSDVVPPQPVEVAVRPRGR